MEKDFSLIEYIVIDVDGTMTDSGIYYDDRGNELKKFSTKDGAGFFAAHKVGIKLIVLTGRECQATTRRMQEMKFDYIFQDIGDKSTFLKKFMQEQGISSNQIGYIGDDLNDYESMKLVGYVGCPIDACPEIHEIADYISPYRGGAGAVRDVIANLLKIRKQWDSVVMDTYGITSWGK